MRVNIQNKKDAKKTKQRKNKIKHQKDQKNNNNNKTVTKNQGQHINTINKEPALLDSFCYCGIDNYVLYH